MTMPWECISFDKCVFDNDNNPLSARETKLDCLKHPNKFTYHLD